MTSIIMSSTWLSYDENMSRMLVGLVLLAVVVSLVFAYNWSIIPEMQGNNGSKDSPSINFQMP